MEKRKIFVVVYSNGDVNEHECKWAEAAFSSRERAVTYLKNKADICTSKWFIDEVCVGQNAKTVRYPHIEYDKNKDCDNEVYDELGIDVFGNKIKFRVINKDKGVVIARFSWEYATWHKLIISAIDIFGCYILQPFNKWERDRNYKVKSENFTLNNWVEVETENLC